ncbi:MAG TPA: hypothetical protein DF613_16810 [Lachnospiraceae bacterium]|nr:hypothetical protein [Lachnospiraceae bacterium]
MKKYIGLEDMSHVNCSSVLRVIQAHGEISRKQISEITGLSWGGMTKIVNKLFEKEYITEEKSEAPGGTGRTPGMLSIRKDRHLVAGVDINRIGLSAYVTDLSGSIKRQYSEENLFEGKEELLDNILRFFQNIFRDFDGHEIEAAGIAMQGGIHGENGVSVSFPGCEDWKDVPIIDMLREQFHTELYLEHDPDCMLCSELVSTGGDHVILFRIDQSIGMAVSLDGTILRGNGILEVAHTIVVPDGKPCRCGLSGCLEAYIEPCMQGGQINSKAVEEMIYPLAVTIHNMACVFHADTVILAGNLMKYASLFEKELLRELRKMQDGEKIQVRFRNDAKSAVSGAALIAARHAIDSIRL